MLAQYRRLAAIVIMVGGNDVFLWLEHGAPPPCLDNYYDFMPYTPAGAAVVARAMAAALLRRPAPAERPRGPTAAESSSTVVTAT